MEKRLDKVEGNQKETNANIGRIVKLCTERSGIIEQMETHIEEDHPVEEVFGKAALKVIWVAAGALGLWLIDRAPRIIELLG